MAMAIRQGGLVVLIVVVVLRSLSYDYYPCHDSSVTPSNKLQLRHQIESDELESQHWIAFTSFGVPAYPDKAGMEVISDHQLLALAFARYANPNRSILLLVDNINRTQAAAAYLRRLNVHVAAIDFQHARFQKFKQNYKHSSLNDEYYEFMCFARFVALDIFMTEQKSRFLSIAHVDTDIALLVGDKPPLLAPEYDAFFMTPYSSFISRFSRPGMATFARFIEEFFDRSPANVQADILIWGQKVDPDQVPRMSRAVSRWLNTTTEVKSDNVTSFRHFSDMHVTQMFVSTSPLRREVMFPERIAVTQPFEVMVNARSIAGSSTCSQNPKGKIFDLEWKRHVDLRNNATMLPLYGVFMEGKNTPLWGIHFQGNCKDVMCQVLCPHLVPEDRQALMCCMAGVDAAA